MYSSFLFFFFSFWWDVRAPHYKVYQRREKEEENSSTHSKASLWLDDHCLVIDCANHEDPPLDLDSNKDQWLGLIRSIMWSSWRPHMEKSGRPQIGMCWMGGTIKKIETWENPGSARWGGGGSMTVWSYVTWAIRTSPIIFSLFFTSLIIWVFFMVYVFK